MGDLCKLSDSKTGLWKKVFEMYNYGTCFFTKHGNICR